MLLLLLLLHLLPLLLQPLLWNLKPGGGIAGLGASCGAKLGCWVAEQLLLGSGRDLLKQKRETYHTGR
jgi:hypothetical protein